MASFFNDKWFTNLLLTMIFGILSIVSTIAIHSWNKITATLETVVIDNRVKSVELTYLKDQYQNIRIDVDMLKQAYYRDKNNNTSYEKANNMGSGADGNTTFFQTCQKSWVDTNSRWYGIKRVGWRFYNSSNAGYNWKLLTTLRYANGSNGHRRYY